MAGRSKVIELLEVCALPQSYSDVDVEVGDGFNDLREYLGFSLRAYVRVQHLTKFESKSLICKDAYNARLVLVREALLQFLQDQWL